jgi:hypothetical protein
MTQDSTILRMSAFWAPWKCAYYCSILRWIIYKTIYDINAVIAPFLRKLQRYAAQLRYFLIHTTKHAVNECTEYMRDLRLAKSFQILSTYFVDDYVGRIWKLLANCKSHMFSVNSVTACFMVWIRKSRNWAAYRCSLRRKGAMAALMSYMVL